MFSQDSRFPPWWPTWPRLPCKGSSVDTSSFWCQISIWVCLKRVKWTSPNPNTIAKHLLQPRFPPLLQYLCIFSHVSRSWIQHVFGGIDSKAMFQCHLKRTKGLKYAKGLGIHRTYPYLRFCTTGPSNAPTSAGFVSHFLRRHQWITLVEPNTFTVLLLGYIPGKSPWPPGWFWSGDGSEVQSHPL